MGARLFDHLVFFESKSSKVTDVIHPGFVDFKQLCLGVCKILFRTPNVLGFPKLQKQCVRTL